MKLIKIISFQVWSQKTVENKEIVFEHKFKKKAFFTFQIEIKTVIVFKKEEEEKSNALFIYSVEFG